MSDEQQKKIESLELEIQKYKFAIEEINDLIQNSQGVAGLHLNGDVATWGWLFGNGWLEQIADLL